MLVDGRPQVCIPACLLGQSLNLSAMPAVTHSETQRAIIIRQGPAGHFRRLGYASSLNWDSYTARSSILS
jgi:hypothetical protein